MSAAPAATAGARETLLAALVQIEQRARACSDEQALAFVMVNDSHALAPYRQAVLWRDETGHGKGSISALSGVAVPAPDAPFNVWLAALLARHADQPTATSAGEMALALDGDDSAMWREHLPAHAWWLPLPLQRGRAALLLLRDAPWQLHETTLLAIAGDAYAHAWRALLAPASGSAGRFLRGRGTRRVWLLAGAAVAVLLLPVRQSVLAPAEVVAHAPEVVRAPLQGVVDSIAVQPNQNVAQGQLLVKLDARDWQGRLESARQALAVAEAEWRQGQQQALFDDRSKAALALLRGKRDQAAADVDYFEQALERTQLRAERAGQALFDDPAEWVGRPVAIGERIMMIASPKDVELEVMMPVSDAISLPDKAEVKLFLNASPASPVAATLQRVAYRAMPTADGTLAYRVRARFVNAQPDDPLRVGLKGTAKIHGERTVLALYLLRKPLSALRVWLSF